MEEELKIIRSQAEIAEASSQVLVNTWNALMGPDKRVKKFENRGIAETRVSMAILSAANATGHLGVPKEREPAVLTFEERIRLAESKGKKLHETPKENMPEEEAQEVLEQLDLDQAAREADERANQEVVDQPLNGEAVLEGKPPPTAAKKKSRRELTRIRATGAGKSQPQARSVRGQVLAYIQKAPDQTVPYSELQQEFGDAARGCVFKLLEKEHVEILD